MTIHHFFVKQENICFPLATITGAENHHLYRVLRIKKGEKVRLFNEDGELFSGQVEETGPEKTIVLLERKMEKQTAKVALTVAQACLKAKQMDWLIQRLTELRIACFVPLLTRRTIVRLDKRGSQKVNRWQRLAVEAAKQCQSSFFPEIEPPAQLNDFFCSRREEIKFYLSERGGKMLREILLTDYPPEAKRKFGSAIVCVGPEGGWEEEEERLFQSHGFEPVSLGARILRAETACLAVISILAHFWNA